MKVVLPKASAESIVEKIPQDSCNRLALLWANQNVLLRLASVRTAFVILWVSLGCITTGEQLLDKVKYTLLNSKYFQVQLDRGVGVRSGTWSWRSEDVISQFDNHQIHCPREVNKAALERLFAASKDSRWGKAYVKYWTKLHFTSENIATCQTIRTTSSNKVAQHRGRRRQDNNNTDNADTTLETAWFPRKHRQTGRPLMHL